MVDERHQNFDSEELSLDRWIELVDGLTWMHGMDGWMALMNGWMDT